MKFLKFLRFDILIAPLLIKLMYWLGVVVILFAGGTAVDNAFTSVAGGVHILLAFFGALFSLLTWRVFTELLILAFNIHERLGEIRDRLDGATIAVKQVNPEG